MCCRTRYAHCASADLYHIEFERSENISNLPRGKYIKPNSVRHIDNLIIEFVKKRGQRVQKHSLSFCCRWVLHSVKLKNCPLEYSPLRSDFSFKRFLRVQGLFAKSPCVIPYLPIYFLTRRDTPQESAIFLHSSISSSVSASSTTENATLGT